MCMLRSIAYRNTCCVSTLERNAPRWVELEGGPLQKMWTLQGPHANGCILPPHADARKFQRFMNTSCKLAQVETFAARNSLRQQVATSVLQIRTRQ